MSAMEDQPGQLLPDKVVPLGIFDDTFLTWDVVYYTMFLFDDAMDVSRLRDGLESLVERDGWRKLGARIRRSPTKGLEYHIPPRFTRDRPAIRFHHVEHDMARADHAVASRIPGVTRTPAVVADADDFQSLWLHPDMPTKLSHYLRGDEPQLGLLVTSFHDATVVSLSWPHWLCDAMGQGEILHAWSLMLQGRSGEVRTPYGVEHDALAGVGTDASEPYRLRRFMLSWLGLALFWLRYLFPVLVRRQHHRVVKAFLKRPFLSEGDVLCAWWTRLNVAPLPRNSGKLVHIGGALGWRAALEDMLPPNRPYIANAMGIFSVLVPLKDTFTKPLSSLAWQIRRSIAESRTRGQVEAYAALWRRMPAMAPPVFGNSTTHALSHSDWSRAKLFEVDFSPAIVKLGADSSSNRPGRPCYVQACNRGVLLANLTVVFGKDCVGNYWLTCVGDAAHWAIVEEAIAGANEDEHD
ncbi:Chloramphenicol acetyltransferase-like domain protein [Ophiocordyceps sinensis CO18]|uniref:Chloramphenicol acetyltransferase-like domain protein n=1 Tax=Ophiocordyceps sinensis (strain Co18 / CGMCC 3.14243) TaxID=911162 RepID=T5AAW1_OPHSC|nr:Chloramphenicol acetyltransferase-like domain protein [Ophiocordyceps sinensis CO18]